MEVDRTRLLLGLILMLAMGAVGVLGVESSEDLDRRADRQAFQELVGGLGLGPSADLSTCPISFDPRLATSCEFRWSPIPGGDWYCSVHSCSLCVYRDAAVP